MNTHTGESWGNNFSVHLMYHRSVQVTLDRSVKPCCKIRIMHVIVVNYTVALEQQFANKITCLTTSLFTHLILKHLPQSAKSESTHILCFMFISSSLFSYLGISNQWNLITGAFLSDSIFYRIELVTVIQEIKSGFGDRYQSSLIEANVC